jgi:hypothetical protein
VYPVKRAGTYRDKRKKLKGPPVVKIGGPYQSLIKIFESDLERECNNARLYKRNLFIHCDSGHGIRSWLDLTQPAAGQLKPAALFIPFASL